MLKTKQTIIIIIIITKRSKIKKLSRYINVKNKFSNSFGHLQKGQEEA